MNEQKQHRFLRTVKLVLTSNMSIYSNPKYIYICRDHWLPKVSETAHIFGELCIYDIFGNPILTYYLRFSS